MPKPLSIAGSLATNCKKHKWSWQNYAIVAKHRFENDFQMVEFLSAIGDDMREFNDGMNFDFLKDRQNFETVIAKFEEFASERQMRHMNLVSLTIKYKNRTACWRVLAVAGMTKCDTS